MSPMMASMAKLKAGRLTREVADSRLQFGVAMALCGITLHHNCIVMVVLGSIGGGADEIMLGIICKLMDILPKKQKG